MAAPGHHCAHAPDSWDHAGRRRVGPWKRAQAGLTRWLAIMMIHCSQIHGADTVAREGTTKHYRQLGSMLFDI